MISGAGKLAFSKVVVEDLERGVAFYRDVCGFKEVMRVEDKMDGRPMIEVVFAPSSEGGASLVVMKYLDGSRPTRGQAVQVILTDDLEAFVARVEQFGGTITERPNIRVQGAKVAFWQDPEGNVVEVAQLLASATIKIGDPLPSAMLFKVTKEGPKEVSTESLFAARRVALISVPGAFTPVCSEKHLPGFIQHADEIKARGVDEIICISVNDVYVVSAWGKQSGAEGKVTVLADDGSFVKALGLTFNIPRFGLGIRGQRFSMLVRDGRVEQLNVERSASDAKLSSAEHLLTQI